jgi:hypothetical protein
VNVIARAGTWGDYFHTLAHEDADDLDRRNGLLELYRTGPFVPPISMPTSVLVVTDLFRTELMNSGSAGFQFQPVIKKKIVAAEWHTWDQNADHLSKVRAEGGSVPVVFRIPDATRPLVLTSGAPRVRSNWCVGFGFCIPCGFAPLRDLIFAGRFSLGCVRAGLSIARCHAEI